MKNRAILLVACFIASGSLFPSKQAAAAPDSDSRVTLLCRAKVNGQEFTENLEINYRDKTVNGLAAVISDTMIKWNSTDFDRYRRTNIVTKHELNRLAGSYRTEGVIGSSAPPIYRCEKATSPKF